MLARQLAPESAPHAIDRTSEDRAVGPREVDELENAALVRLGGYRPPLWIIFGLAGILVVSIPIVALVIVRSYVG